MKAYIIHDKPSRIILTVLVNLVPAAWITLFATAGAQGVNLFSAWLNAGTGIFILLIIMTALSFTMAVYCTLLFNSRVTVSETGVLFHLGRLVFNSATWDQIEDVELAEVWGKGERRLVINVVVKGRRELVKIKRATLNIFGKKRTCFMYRADVYAEIKKYYSQKASNEYLTYHYTDNGVPNGK